MLRFALLFLFGPARAPHQPLKDLSMRERTILGALVVGIFALGLFPDGPLQKTELAAKAFQTRVQMNAGGAGAN